MVAVLLVIGLFLIRKENNLTIYYLVGWAALIVFVFVQNARDNGSIGDNFFTRYAFYFGALADELCFSLALTVRINKLKAEKEQERQKLIQADKLVTLGTMASSMAHEMANPNTVFSSNVEFLKAQWEHISPVLDKADEFAARLDGYLTAGSDVLRSEPGEYAYPVLMVSESLIALMIMVLFSLLASLRPGLKLCCQKITNLLTKNQKSVFIVRCLFKSLCAPNTGGNTEAKI